MIPSADSVWPIRDRPSSTMIRKSQQSVSSLPPPRAWPLMAAITGFGQRSMVENRSFIRLIRPPICSTASGALRSMLPSMVRSAPTLKYFSYSEASTTTRTAGSSPSSRNAAASSCIKSSAIALLPFRCITTRAIAPSRLTSTHSPIFVFLRSGGEQGDAAGDLDDRARDVPRLVRAEERDGVGNVLGLPKPFEHSPGLESLVQGIRLGRGFARFGFDDPGRDRVGRDVVPPAFECSRLGEADESRLGGRIARLAEAAQSARDRRHEDEAAPLVFHQVRPDLLRAVESPGEIDSHVSVPELVRLVWDLRRVVEGGGVVDQDVDLAELVFDLLEHVAYFLPVWLVHLHL